MKRSTHKAALVLCGASSIHLLRCFMKEHVQAVIASTDPEDYTFHSRYCDRREVITALQSSPRQFVCDLLRIGQSLKSKGVLIYGDDAVLLAISRHRETLAPFYRFLMPDAELLEDVVDKLRFARLADRLGLPVPRTILSSEIRNPDDALQEVMLPCVLKPGVHIGWGQSQAVRDSGGMPRKVLFAQSPEEFGKSFRRMQEFTSDFVVQEWIPGGPQCIYSFHAIYSRQSEPLAYFVGRKVRTYPEDSGQSTYLELVTEPEVVRLGLEILKSLKFVGPVKIDFKKDQRRNRLYLLEVNARYNLWHYLGAASGVNIPETAFAHLTGQPLSVATAYRTDLRWLSFGIDFRAFIRDYHPSGSLTWWQWLSSYRCAKVYSLFSWSDPYPFLFNSLRYVKGKFLHVTRPTALTSPTGRLERQ